MNTERRRFPLGLLYHLEFHFVKDMTLNILRQRRILHPRFPPLSWHSSCCCVDSSYLINHLYFIMRKPHNKSINNSSQPLFCVWKSLAKFFGLEQCRICVLSYSALSLYKHKNRCNKFLSKIW